MNSAFALFSFCAGIAIYFTLPLEPSVAYPLLIAALCAANFFVWRKNRAAIVFALLFGFFYSALYTRLIDIPRITYPKRDIEISGIVKGIDYTPDRIRIFIKTSLIGAGAYGRPEDATTTPMLVRLSMAADSQLPGIGDEITATATLFPPRAADSIGGFDSAEWAYFAGISATGVIKEMSVTNPKPKSDIATLRDYMHHQFRSPLFDSLVLGYKRTMTAEENNAWKAAGVAHVFAISGFHMTLVGGWLFAIFYFLFRAMPAVTRRSSARYPAMICAWFGLLFYLFLSGANVATQRAFLMTSFVFAAFMFGRSVFSMRNACIVFVALLLACPHYLLQAGFQLSFSAIFGLIWYFSGAKYAKLSRWQKVKRGIKAMVMTTMVATLFTGPFIAYHFNMVQIYSLIGNLLCLPIFSFLIMPLVLLGRVEWAGTVYGFALDIARWIETLPAALLQIPRVSGPALTLMVVGLLCLIMVKNKRMQIIATASCFLLSAIWITASPRPVFYASADHELIGLVKDGKLHFNRNKASGNNFAFDSWKLSNFEQAGTINLRIKCEKGLCEINTEKWNLAYTQKFIPLLNNMEKLCAENDFIVSYLKIEAPNCRAEILRGGFVIYKSGKVEYVTANRYWHIRPKQNTDRTAEQ
ncbi:MAG: ComEC family competence protein [Alphaproteobacteria bacterium]|nr:ComEC family competence protein [Alphaproteobacteria bacterium]